MNVPSPAWVEIRTGDPSLGGWVITVSYFLVAALCWVVRRDTPRSQAGHRGLWGWMIVLLLLLGVNKQLDLQVWMRNIGQRLAEQQGWSDYRRVVQGIFFAGFALVAVGAAAWVVRQHWNLHGFPPLAWLGGGLLVAFVLWRAASAGHVDEWIGLNFDRMVRKSYWEFGAILCVGWAAVQTTSRLKSPGRDLQGAHSDEA